MKKIISLFTLQILLFSCSSAKLNDTAALHELVTIMKGIILHKHKLNAIKIILIFH